MLKTEMLPMVVSTPEVPALPIRYIQKRGCRRFVMRLKGNHLQVTLPERYSEAEVRRFVMKNLPWVNEQIAKLKVQPPAVEAFGIGSKVFLRGELVELLAAAGSEGFVFDGKSFPLASSSREIKLAVYNHIYQLAWAELPQLTLEYAQKAGLRVTKVTVRNQKSRWGSCSARAAISLNWRLIQTPDFVRDYIIYHELMHLREMNHSAKFWRAVEEVYPDYPRAEKWLKENSALLKL